MSLVAHRGRRHPNPRRWLAASLAVALAALLAGSIAVPEVAAATPDLTIVANARYDVQPNRARVVVTADLTATNHLHDTTTRRYYFDRAFLAVLPGASAFSLTSATGNPSVRVSRSTRGYTLLAVNFGQRIYSGKSATFRLRFELRDRGGDATRDVRIGGSLVSFPVWAFASQSTPGSTVSVIFPKGYSVTVEAGEIGAPTKDRSGRTILRSGPLASPLRFFAYVVADRAGSYRTTPITTSIGGATASVTIRAWRDDPAWAKRVGRLFKRGLPVLGSLIGLPWARQEPLLVQEAVSRTTGGYAGMFDPSAARVEVAYYADGLVILHEASHAWFNGALLADRWANEAFASYYALAAAGRLKEKVTPDTLTAALRKARIPLNAWGEVGREDVATEDYAYAASLELARAVAQRAGVASLKKVWAAAASRQGAYQPPITTGAGEPPVETVDGPPDWRGLLDLLEETTGKRFDDLWRAWIVRPTELALLQRRAAARTEYASAVAAAGTWQLPPTIRQAMRAWQFDDATRLLAEARSVLARRNELERIAAAAGLTLPAQLETAFENGGDFAAANAEVAAETAAMQTLSVAAAARPPDDNPLVQIGLLGLTPDASLKAAREAFAAGDLRLVAANAAAAQSAWLGAEELGRNRVMAGVGVALIALMALALFVGRVRGHRRRRRILMAHPFEQPGLASLETRSRDLPRSEEAPARDEC